jgi:hypothetical protein
MARSKEPRTPAPSCSTTAGTSSIGVSPVFSTKTSVQPTPDTSDIDQDVAKAVGRPKRITRMSASAASKRPAESDRDSDNDVEEDLGPIPKKRRAVTRTAYIEIPVKRGIRLTSRAKAEVMTLAVI